MAATENMENMYDVALKPRLLRSLVREFVPDEKHPFRSPSDLSHVVSAVKLHRLLSEWSPPSTEQSIIDNWKARVDAWVNRLLTLVSHSSADKAWAGICLIGVTCQECSSERFLASYSEWFNKLLLHIQSSTSSPFVKTASCASLSDLFTRLSEYPNEKKDGNSLATKVVQPILKLLNEDSPESALEEAVNLLCTIINIFPQSVQRHYDNVEAAIVVKMMSGKCSDSLLKKFRHSLILLPKSKGDAESWSLMMQKILVSLNSQMNDAFQGLEEETRRNKTMKLLLPPGKDPPPPLGGQTVLGGNSGQAIKRPELSLVSRTSTLMHCCSEMLTNTYPVQVSVPVRSLIALAERVLMVDGSSSRASYPFLNSTRLEFICSELPVLHMHSLDLLYSIVQGLRSLVLPYIPDIVRLLTEYFTSCTMPELRTKLYSVIKLLLLSTGVGIVVYVSEEIISNAHLDLDSVESESGGAEAAQPQPRQKKRKHSNTSGPPSEQSNREGLNLGKTLNPSPITVRIAALEALEALLTVGGALRSESWRSNVDNLLITVATNACKDGWVKEEENSKYTPGSADFQLAAFRALLASLISPCHVRPRYLSQGLELFRKGTQERGTRIGEFCSHSLLSLEVLIHPRGLPLLDHDDSVNRNSQDTLFSSRKKSKGPHETDLDHDDPLENWIDSDEEMEASNVDPVTDVAVPAGTANGDDIMVESHHAQETSKPSNNGEDFPAPVLESVKSDAFDNSNVSNLDKGKGSMYEAESDTDSIPSIVDGDPDSD